MLVLRRLFRSYRTSDSAALREIDIYLYADGSPQWGVGLELFTMVIEIVSCGKLERRLMPLISLSKDMLDTLGKTVCLLWALWLIGGPSFEDLRWLLSRVRGMSTDMGTERNIVDQEDMLRHFFRVHELKHQIQSNRSGRRVAFPACFA